MFTVNKYCNKNFILTFTFLYRHYWKIHFIWACIRSEIAPNFMMIWLMNLWRQLLTGTLWSWWIWGGGHYSAVFFYVLGACKGRIKLWGLFHAHWYVLAQMVPLFCVAGWGYLTFGRKSAFTSRELSKSIAPISLPWPASFSPLHWSSPEALASFLGSFCGVVCLRLEECAHVCWCACGGQRTPLGVCSLCLPVCTLSSGCRPAWQTLYLDHHEWSLYLHVYLWSAVLGMESRASHMPDKHCLTDLDSQLLHGQ